MGHDDLREIFERLDALERLARSRSGEHRGWQEHHGSRRDRHDQRWEEHRGGRDRHDHGHHEGGRGGGDDFDEKRIIDTVVRLVGERVERVIQDQQAKMKGRDDGGDEKRVIDLVVRLVGEHVREIVQEIVSTELDRRFGRAGGEGPGGNPPPVSGSSGPEQR